MISRRVLLGTAVAPMLAGAAGPPGWPESGEIAFRVVRRGSTIGSHVLRISTKPDGFDVGIAVDIAVKMGPVALFRYTLRGTEQWRGGVVARMSVDTDDNGTASTMRAERDGKGLWVTGSTVERYLAPPDALPATHWNCTELDGAWINPQDGKLFHPHVSRSGTDAVAISGGQEVPAQHYVVSGDVKMQLWYDEARRWTALLFVARDGSEVRYELT